MRIYFKIPNNGKKSKKYSFCKSLISSLIFAASSYFSTTVLSLFLGVNSIFISFKWIYLYTLKEQGWNFNGADNESGIETIGYDTLDEMARVQRQFDVTFTMPIPRNLGEDYGKAFEREGVMIAAIPLMYDDLKNKDVNWHRVLIYRENELTPYQRYRQRKEAAEKQFDSARQEEIRSTLAYSRSQNEMDSMLSNTENKGQVDTASMRVSKW